MTSISFVIPTHNRTDDVQKTMDMLGRYPIELLGDARRVELIVVDNASDTPVDRVLPSALANGIGVQSIRLETNIATKARNIGVEHAAGDWIVMLDDDSAPIAGDLGKVLTSQHAMVGAIGGEIRLSTGGYEAGGLPEVVIGCGCAIRREAYLQVGGYDDSFGYYAEEYDLCAKLIGAGYRVGHTRAMVFEHRKVLQGRNFSEILYRLVRNNAWVLTRYAPIGVKDAVLSEMFDRYQQIAIKEGVEPAFVRAMGEVEGALETQPIRTLNETQWERFSGAAAVRAHLVPRLQSKQVETVRMVAPGKGLEIIEHELARAGIQVNDESAYQVVGTLSPGSMLDAQGAWGNAFSAWVFDHKSMVPEPIEHDQMRNSSRSTGV